jgi:hypothetical protein
VPWVVVGDGDRRRRPVRRQGDRPGAQTIRVDEVLLIAGVPGDELAIRERQFEASARADDDTPAAGQDIHLALDRLLAEHVRGVVRDDEVVQVDFQRGTELGCPPG